MTRLRLAACLIVCLTACTSPPAVVDSATPAGPFAEVYDQGGARYLGAFEPDSVAEDAGVTTLTWGGAEGPSCLRGTPYRASWRAGNGEDLMLFFQGGGACWSDFCFAIEEAGADMPALDVFDPVASPVGTWDTMYLPYCDGSLFAGDIDIDDDGDGEADRLHRGLANLSAALDAAHDRAPAPRRILIAGSSGGGFGTLLAPALVRRLWPGVPIDVMNDAGVGIARPGDDAFVDGLLDEWGVDGLVPESCADCIAGGHLTGLVGWALGEDPNLRVGAFSSTRDAVIAGIFLRVPGEQFEAALRTELGGLHERFPERYQPFIVAGDLHTALLGDIRGFLGDTDPALAEQIQSIVTLGSMDEVAVDGVTVGQWLGHMVTEDPAWAAHVEGP